MSSPDTDPGRTATDLTPLDADAPVLAPDTAVLPGDEPPAAHCPYCDRPFDGEPARDLHVGERHPAEMTDDEAAAYETAIDAENDDLFLYHIKVIVALGIIHGVVVLVYMAMLG